MSETCPRCNSPATVVGKKTNYETRESADDQVEHVVGSVTKMLKCEKCGNRYTRTEQRES